MQAGLKLGLVAGLLLLISIPTFHGLWMVWSTQADPFHIFLIPLIALALVKSLWPEIRRLPLRPSPGLGLPALLVALTGLLLGSAGAIITLAGLSFIVLLASLILTLFGRAWLRAVLFPVAYLTFMVPIVDTLAEPFQPHFQLLTAIMAHTLLTQFSIPVFQESTMLHLPTGTVQVAAECSGIGFLISLLAIGMPLVMLGLRTWSMRAALIVTTLTLGLCINWIRVALIALSGHLWGWGSDLHGPLHLLHAMSVYWIGLALLFVGIWIGRHVEENGPRRAMDTRPPGALTEGLAASHGWTYAWVAPCLLMSLAAIALYGPRSRDVQPLQDLSQFPSTVGDWEWEPSIDDRPIFTVEQADQQISRSYRNAAGDRVQLYLGYMDSQAQGKELINPRTEQLHRQATPRKVGKVATSFTVNHRIWEQADRPHQLLFWYQAQGRMLADRLSAKLTSALYSLFGQGSNGAFVLISQQRASDHAISQPPDDSLDRFAQLVSPILREYLP